jgi:Fe-S cluster assembly protein SufD
MQGLQTNYLTPTGREEAWRFTPLARMGGLHDGTVQRTGDVSLYLRAGQDNAVTFSQVSADSLSPFSQSDDAVVLHARSEVSFVSHVSVAKGASISEPIYLGRKSVAGEYSRVKISLGINAHAKIILENSGNTILGEDLEIELAAGASLTFISLQEWGSDAIYSARHHAILDRDATLDSIVVTLGGSLVRILPTVEFRGEGASVSLNGVYFASAGQHQEHRLHVDHLVPRAKSRVNYKGALTGDKAHTVWIGDVFIRAAAEGTDTYELNRNLLLSDGARADSVPNLEIETGDIVGAGHASTTGRFDDEQLFYLMSRGIDRNDARRLVVRGFFAEVINNIGAEEIQERLMAHIDGELSRVGA